MAEEDEGGWMKGKTGETEDSMKNINEEKERTGGRGKDCDSKELNAIALDRN